MENILLIGNGINRLKDQNSLEWSDLLTKLSTDYAITVDLKNPLKPFPLSFDEMTNLKAGNNSFENKIRNLKQKINNSFFELANQNGDTWHNDYHLKFLELEHINTLLTTNYDYGFETAIENEFLKQKVDLAIDKNESIHSTKRCYKIQNKKIWHIHGELTNNRNYKSSIIKNYPEESIMIGFGHYARYHNKIMNLINGKSVAEKLQHSEVKEWPFYFFNSNIHIIGFGLDFSESHIWWLLQKRKEFLHRGIYIKNNICFYHLESERSSVQLNFKDEEEYFKKVKSEINLSKTKAKIEVLKSLGVKIESITCNSDGNEKYTEFYDKVLDKLNEQLLK